MSPVSASEIHPLEGTNTHFLEGAPSGTGTPRGIRNSRLVREPCDHGAGEAWHFAQLGRLLERADKTSRILDVKYFILLPSVQDIGTPYDDVQWSAVLKSVSGFEMYRKCHGRIDPRRIVEFLMLDNEFPRAVHYCLGRADRSLHVITGSPAGAFACAAEQRLGLLRSELDYAPVDSIFAGGLHEFLDALQVKMNKIDERVSGDFHGGPLERTSDVMVWHARRRRS